MECDVIVRDKISIEDLHKMNVIDFMDMIFNNIKDYEKDDAIYTAKELEDLYPKLFSKYKLSQAIKNDHLPFFKSGRERFFRKSDIDNWIKNKKGSINGK